MTGKEKCSFCAKTIKQVRKLIAAPGVFICDECVLLCTEILAEEVGFDWAEEAAAAPQRLDLAKELVSDQTVSQRMRDAAEEVLLRALQGSAK